MMWCAACGAMRVIVDTHEESTYDGGSNGAREYGYTVTDLVCGHEVTTRPQVVGPAPGAPYAGHNDLLDARDRQAAEDRGEVTS